MPLKKFKKRLKVGATKLKKASEKHILAATLAIAAAGHLGPSPIGQKVAEEIKEIGGKITQVLSQLGNEDTLKPDDTSASDLFSPQWEQIENQKDQNSPKTTPPRDTKDNTNKSGTKETRPSINVQSPEEARKTQRAIDERLQKIDVAQLNAYKEITEKRLRSGEFIPAQEIFPTLEHLNGVDSIQTNAAREQLQNSITKYAAQVGTDFTDDFLKKLVEEKFGDGSNYMWGQGSLVDYENTGIYNCTSIEQDINIIIEGLLQRFPEEIRKQYIQGVTFEEDHIIATLWKINPETQKIEKTYLLQSPFEILEGEINKPGTAIATFQDIKVSTVSKKTLVLKAKPGKFSQGPDISAISNQPIDFNIRIEGELRSSSFNEEALQKQKKKAEMPSQPTEFTEIMLIPEDPGPIEARKRVVEALKYQNDINIGDFISPSINTIQALKARNRDERQKLRSIDAGTLAFWKQEAIENLLKLSYPLKVKTYQHGSLAPQFLESLKKEASTVFNTPGAVVFPNITINNIEPTLSEDKDHRPPPKQLQTLISALGNFMNPNIHISIVHKPRLNLSYPDLIREEAEIISKARNVNIYFTNGENISWEMLKVLLPTKNSFTFPHDKNEGLPEITFTSKVYVKLLNNYPEIVNYPFYIQIEESTDIYDEMEQIKLLFEIYIKTRSIVGSVSAIKNKKQFFKYPSVFGMSEEEVTSTIQIILNKYGLQITPHEIFVEVTEGE